MKGYRKVIVFVGLLGVAALKLDGTELASVIITLATVFGAANAFENFKKGD